MNAELSEDKYEEADNALENGYYHMEESEAVTASEIVFSNAAEDMDLEANLLGYRLRGYKEKNQAAPFFQLLEWLITNKPELPVLRSVHLLYGVTSGEFRAMMKLWYMAVQRDPLNVLVLDHAAAFCRPRSKLHSEMFWKTAREVEPHNPKWPFELANLYRGMCGFSAKSRRKAVRFGWPLKAVSCATEALRLLEDGCPFPFLGQNRNSFLKTFGDFAIDFGLAKESRVFSELLKEDGREHSIDFGLAIEGRSKLLQDDLAGAVQCLNNMTRSGTPNTLGFVYVPDLSLAIALSKTMEVKKARDYLERCLYCLRENLLQVNVQPPNIAEELRHIDSWELQQRKENLIDAERKLVCALKDFDERQSRI